MKTWKKNLFNAFIESNPFRKQLFSKLAPRDKYDTLLILTYHMVAGNNPYLPDWCCLPTGQFKAQMNYLARHFEVVELSRGLSSLARKEKRQKPLAAVTFDDGFYNNFSEAFPVLKAAAIPATIFLSTGYVDTEDTIWFCRLNRALHRTPRKTLRWQGHTYDLSSLPGKLRAFRELQRLLKQLPNRRLQQELGTIISALGDDPEAPIGRSSILRMLDRDAILEMKASGLITFGAHTEDHAILSLESRGEQKKQIQSSTAYVRRLTGQDDVVFAYPNGSRDDYNAISLEEAAGAGISCAVTMREGFNRVHTAPLELRRIGVGGDWKMGLFQFAVHAGSSPEAFSGIKSVFSGVS